MASPGLETSDLLLWEVVLMTGPRDTLLPGLQRSSNSGQKHMFPRGSITLAMGPLITFVLCPWTQTVREGLWTY